jgi:hypothetical protein
LTDIEKARQLFRDSGLAFPTIPEELAAQLKEQGRWLFSTRPLGMSPYNLQHYVDEVERTPVKDYAVLCHSGHGVNSYAIQYYLVRGPLNMFLHLGWGGVYMDAKASAAQVRDCFLIADEVVKTVRQVDTFKAGERLTVVGSDFYGSYWLPPGRIRRRKDEHREDRLHLRPMAALTKALGWVKSHRAGKRSERVAMNRNVRCEINRIRDGKPQWEPISIEEALGLDRTETKRCPECHGEMRAHRAGNTASSPAHFEHRESHDGCSHSMAFDGKARIHPHPLE